MSFDKSTYDVNEGDGGVDLTLQLSRPLPIGFNDSTFQLQLVDVNDHNASTLCRCVCVCLCCVCTHVYELVTLVHVHQYVFVCVDVRMYTFLNAYAACVMYYMYGLLHVLSTYYTHTSLSNHHTIILLGMKVYNNVW